MALNKNTSSGYEDIISNCIRISPGPPSVYLLKPEKKIVGSITVKSLGIKNHNKVNKTILLVGETGAGKSTLINALVNYMMGVKWEDEVWFQIVEEEGRSQSESQTSDVMVYQIFGCQDETLPYSLTIIDTPGFGDTRGIERDVVISQRLLDLLRSLDGVHEITAVGVVMKATDCRLSDRLMYVLKSVRSIFGEDIEKNIIALITHSNGRRPKNVLKVLEAANIKCAKDQKNDPVYFLFDNCQDEDRKEDVEDLEHANDITMKGMKQFAEFLGRTAPQKLQKPLDVLNEHIRVTACIQNLQDKIKLVEQKQSKVQQLQKELEKREQGLKKEDVVTVEVDKTYKVKKPIDGGMRLFFYKGAVTCNICKENCHYPGCTVAWSPESCEVMRNGHCTVCTGRCPAPAHMKDEWIYINRTRKVKEKLQDVTVRYEKKNQDYSSILKEKMEKLTAEKSKLLDEAYQHVVSLEKIALNVVSLSTHVDLDFLIEKMKEKGDRRKVQKLEEMRNAMDKDVLAALRYMSITKLDEGSLKEN